jgi:ABC-type oligopeptide transport system substrate-binding subunit
MNMTENGSRGKSMNVMMFNTTEQHKMTAEVVQQMWRETLGVAVELTKRNESLQSLSRDRDGNIYRSSWVQITDANNSSEVFATAALTLMW